MFLVEMDNKELEKVFNAELAALGDEYYEGFEIQAENLILDMLICNDLYYYAVDYFWKATPMGIVAAEK